MKKFTLFKNSKTKKVNLIDQIEVALSCAAFLVFWQILSVYINKSILLPSPIQSVIAIFEIAKEPNFFINIGSTVFRVIAGFFLSLCIALIFAILGFLKRSIKNLIFPIITLVSSIPSLILIIIILIWFDKNLTPYIIAVAITMPILYESILSALIGIDENIIEMLKLYKVNLLEIVKTVYIPTIVNKISLVSISTISLALKVTIAGEIYAQPKYGIGAVIQTAKINFETDKIFGWILIILCISYLFRFIQNKIGKKINYWQTNE